MGMNDRLDLDPYNFFDDDVELPKNSGKSDTHSFDPDDEWLMGATEDQQIEAMRLWFLARYEDPANSTPYNSREGGYQFVQGGPVDPNDEIQERFSEAVPYEVMEKLISHLQDIHGDEWAPIDWPDESEFDYYDQFLDIVIADRSEPRRMLSNRLADIEHIISSPGDQVTARLVIPLAYGAAITALESYLWDTAKYWSDTNDAVFKGFVENNLDLKAEKTSLSDIYKALEGIKARQDKHLQEFIWHRLEKVKPMFESAMGIKFPEFADLMRAVVKRHDIIHRGGRNKEGEAIEVTPDDVRALRANVDAFASELERQIAIVFPDLDQRLFGNS